MSQYDETRKFVRESLARGEFPTPAKVHRAIAHGGGKNRCICRHPQANGAMSRGRIDEFVVQGLRKGSNGRWYAPCNAVDQFGDSVLGTCTLKAGHDGDHEDGHTGLQRGGALLSRHIWPQAHVADWEDHVRDDRRIT